MTEPKPPVRNQLLEEAAAWFAKMRGPDAEASRDAFDAWLARGALHRRAYNRAAEIFAMGKLLGDDQAKTPMASGRTIKHRHQLRLFAASSVAVLLLFAVGLWLSLHSPIDDRPSRSPTAENGAGRPSRAVRMATADGETRTVRLEDGSLLILASGTSVAAILGPRVRRLRLDRGAARFDVAPEPRPFIVEAGGGSVVARGTIFEVRLDDNRRVSVRLIEGVVDVTLPTRPADSEARTPQRLRPGEVVSFATANQRSADGSAGAQDGSAAVSRAAAAQSAREFDRVRLAALIAEANRGTARPIRLTNPADGERQVSGRFRIDDSDLLAERVAALFNLAIDRRDPGVIILTAR